MISAVEHLVDRFAAHQISRRELVTSLTALVAGLSAPAAAQSSAVAQGRTLNHPSLAVSDVDRNPANRTSGGDQLYFTDPDNTRVQLSANGYQG